MAMNKDEADRVRKEMGAVEHHITCVWCGAEMDSALPTKPENARIHPTDGDITLCMSCGYFATYDSTAPGHCRKPSIMDRIAIMQSKTLQKAELAWLITTEMSQNLKMDESMSHEMRRDIVVDALSGSSGAPNFGDEESNMVLNRVAGATKKPGQTPWSFLKDLPRDAPFLWIQMDKEADMEHALGFLPTFVNHMNERSLVQQLDANYSHGGGWHPQKEWKLVDKEKLLFQYPGDPAMHPIAAHRMRDEFMIVYEHGLVCVMQLDQSFEMARMD
jgi:hypothetical protein